MRGIVRERGSGVRSSSCSAARSTPATSRAPQASVSAKLLASARGRDELLDDGGRDALAGRPRRQLVDLGRELVEVVADEHDQRAACLRVGRRAVQLELLRRPSPGRPFFATSQISSSPVGATAFASGASFFSSPPTSASVVAGAGALRYAATAFASSAFHASTPSTTISRPSPAKSPSAFAGCHDVLAGRVRCGVRARRRPARTGRAAAAGRGRPSAGRSRRGGRRASARRPSPPSIGRSENDARDRGEAAVRRDLGERQRADRARAKRDVGREPAVQPRDAAPPPRARRRRRRQSRTRGRAGAGSPARRARSPERRATAGHRTGPTGSAPSRAPHAVETATAVRTKRGIGYPSSTTREPRRRG